MICKEKPGKMTRRFITIWFCYLKMDWFALRQPALATMPFVLALPRHGRMIINDANLIAKKEGVDTGMLVSDARAIAPSLQVLDDQPELPFRLLNALAKWFVRYTPAVAIDLPDVLILDITGCAHLWGGEKLYLTHIITRLKHEGYTVKATVADTIGTAWAVTRYGEDQSIIEIGQQATALLSLPPAALRIENDVIETLEKLGLRQVKQFISMPRATLRRRFGHALLKRLDQALGYEEEIMVSVNMPEPYQERLPCLEAIVTLTGITIALEHLLEDLCYRLKKESKGLRGAVLKCYRVDGKVEEISIGTNRASNNASHIFKLFEFKLPGIEPALGIELFILDAIDIEEVTAAQETLWQNAAGLDSIKLAELLDRIAGKFGAENIHRYLPAEHHWPERSFKKANNLQEKSTTSWKTDRPRPIHLLSKPAIIQVTASLPDFLPLSFTYKEILHKITQADGPERIEQEWWLQEGGHRDYYCVEDEEGRRYWIFRSGQNDVENIYQWFLHGFFA